MVFVEFFKKQFFRCLENNRGILIVLFCLPASFIFDFIINLAIWLRRKLYSSPEKHFDRVRQIQISLLKWNSLKKEDRLPMCTSRPNWLSLSLTFFNKKNCHQIEIPLYDILVFDKERMIIKVEPNVSIYELTAFLNPKGYSLAITLEIGDATAGGLAFGVGMTSYSHKVGLFQETIVSYDVVLADGRLIHVTKNNEHSDLFYCLPWSHGTLAFLVALELKVIPIKPYVRLEYIPTFGQDNYCSQMMKLSGANDSNYIVPDFLEATIFDKESSVIIVGNFDNVDTQEKEKKINHICSWYKPWFYKHTETFLNSKRNNKKNIVEYIPVREYLLRHNRAIFWVLESMIPFGNNFIFRFFFGWLCPPKPAFLKLTTTNKIREMTFTKQVFQDIVMPLSTLKKQINAAIELFDTFPLLVYPCRIYNHRNGASQGQIRSPLKELIVPNTNYAMYNDLGVYGTPGPVKKKIPYNATTAMRAMEKFTRDVNGYSFLYADIFMTESEFEEMFDLSLYKQVRQKYGANEAFPSLYEKVKPEIDVFAIGNKFAQQN